MNLSIDDKNPQECVRAVLFDLDGVLIETERETFIFYQRYLKQHYGILLPDSAFQFKAGRKSVDFWRDALTSQQRNVVDTEKLTALKREEFNMHPDTYIKEVPGGKDLLAALLARGLKTALATQNEARMMHTVLEWLGIEDLFDIKLSLADIKKKKPDPEIYLKAANLLSLEPGQCVVVEDSQDGVNAAKNAGMACIAFAHPYTPASSHDRADHIVTALPDVISFLTNKKRFFDA